MTLVLVSPSISEMRVDELFFRIRDLLKEIPGHRDWLPSP